MFEINQGLLKETFSSEKKIPKKKTKYRVKKKKPEIKQYIKRGLLILKLSDSAN